MEPSADLIPPDSDPASKALSISECILEQSFFLFGHSSAQATPPRSQFTIPSVCFLHQTATCASLTSCIRLQLSGSLDPVTLELMSPRLAIFLSRQPPLLQLPPPLTPSANSLHFPPSQSKLLLQHCQDIHLTPPPIQADSEQKAPPTNIPFDRPFAYRTHFPPNRVFSGLERLTHWCQSA